MPLTPSATRTDTPVPYATLFRSDVAVISAGDAALAVQADPHAGGVPTGGQDAGAEFPRICEVAPAEDVAADDAAVDRQARPDTGAGDVVAVDDEQRTAVEEVHRTGGQIGRESCRERVCQYV